MILYHGSEFAVERPRFGLGKRTNDYGQGFYCTQDQSLAGEWSVTPLHDGFTNAYELDLSGLNGMGTCAVSMAFRVDIQGNRDFCPDEGLVVDVLALP